MPFLGRSLGEASRVFVEHLNQVLHTTVTQMPLSLEISRNVANIRFRRGFDAATARLQTQYGPMALYVGYLCNTVVDASGVHELRIASYRYALLPDGHTESLLRWEYIRTPADDAEYCRNHVQGPISLGISNRSGEDANLQHWHLPTGWVPLEEVIRFCIVDLGVPVLTDRWSQTLRESSERIPPEFVTAGDASAVDSPERSERS
jgi:hypothetical protein